MRKLILLLLIGTVSATEVYSVIWWPTIDSPSIIAHNVYCSQMLDDYRWGEPVIVAQVPMPENQLLISSTQLVDGDYNCHVKSVDFRGKEGYQSDGIYLSIINGTVVDLIETPKAPQSVQLR